MDEYISIIQLIMAIAVVVLIFFILPKWFEKIKFAKPEAKTQDQILQEFVMENS